MKSLLIKFTVILIGFWLFVFYGHAKAEQEEWICFAINPGKPETYCYYQKGSISRSFSLFGKGTIKVWTKVVRKTASNFDMACKRSTAEELAQRQKKPLPVTDEDVEELWNEHEKEQEKILEVLRNTKIRPVRPDEIAKKAPTKEEISNMLEETWKRLSSAMSKSKGDFFMGLYEIRCSDKMSHLLQGINYDKDGEPVREYPEEKWSHIAPGTIMEGLHKVVCP